MLTNNDDDDTSSSSTEDIVAKPSNNNYHSMVHDLFKEHPNADYGHFESCANAMYCHDCKMMLQPKYVSRIPCKVPEVVVQQDGTVIYVHSKCEKLDLKKYYASLLVIGYLNWEISYWQVWSECHFLTCITCKLSYPVKNSAMCQYHPEIPEFLPIGNSGLEQPTGRYPCCGERAFRFELVKNPFGCKFRMHVPDMDNKNYKKIVKLMNRNMDLTVASPPACNRESKNMDLFTLESGIKRPNYQHWWVKLTLGGNDYTKYTPTVPTVSSECNSLTGEKKLEKKKNLNKKGKKNLTKQNKSMNIDNKQPIGNASKSSTIVKENENVSSPISDEKPENLINQENMFKKTLTIIDQDLQREQERIFFDKIKNKNVISTGTPDKPRDRYTVILANVLAEIEAQNKSKMSKPTKSIIDKKKKL